MEATSIEAYHNLIRSGKINTVHQIIMNYFIEKGSGITYSIAKWTNLQEDQVHKRLSELEKMNLIKKTRIKYVSPGSGQLQSIWARVDKMEIRIKI